jgi:hypothetical protein
METISVLAHSYDRPINYLCMYHGDDMVRATVHSLLRMESCRLNKSGVLSPCYPSIGYTECRNRMCPYVIGHSIYLWVGDLRQAILEGEEKGCGCTFMHSKPERMLIRYTVFLCLEENFRMQNLLTSLPVKALQRVKDFHQKVVQRELLRGGPTEMTFTFNVSQGKPERARIFKSNDEIFEWNFDLDEEEEEEFKEDDKLFPPLIEDVPKTVPEYETSLPKKDPEIPPTPETSEKTPAKKLRRFVAPPIEGL